MTGRLGRLPPLPLQHALVASLCLGLALANGMRLGWLAGALAALVPGAALCLARSSRARLALACSIVALGGLWLGSLRLSALDRSVLVPLAGKSGKARVVVGGPARSSAFGVSAPATLERFGLRRMRERVQIELPPGKAPAVGAELELFGRIALPSSESKTGFDQRAWLGRQGIHVVLKASSWRQVGRRDGIAGLGDRLRDRLGRDLAPGLTGERRGLVLGFVLGEDEGLSPEIRQQFRRSGLYHLMAVSGQNIAFLVAGVLMLFWLAGLSRLVGEVFALVAIGAYVLVVGWQPSVIRAAVAGALASLAWLAARERDRWYFLLLGAATLLAWNPRSLLDPGFQLSFAAVISIFTCERPLERRLERCPLPASIQPAVAVSLCCSLATTPVMLLQFGQVPVYGVAANALVEPVVPFILFLGLGCALIAPVLSPAATALALVNGWLAAYIALCARSVAALPGAQAGSGRLLLYSAIALVALVARRLGPRERRRLLLASALVLLSLLAWQHRSPPPPPRGLRITFLDVGEGDATLLQTAAGAVLFDAGPPDADVAGQLRRLGVRRLEALVLSHPHRDHVGGAAEVLRQLRVGLLLDPGIAGGDSEERDALREAHDRGVPIRIARAGQDLGLGDLHLRLLWPPPEGAVSSGDANETAIVAIASYGSTDVLLSADAESDVTLPLQIPPLEVYKVAHHGSADEGLPRLLERMRPQVAVISVGDNDFGHPTPSTLALLARAPGLAVFRTDLDGPVVLESDGCEITVRGRHAGAVSLPCA